MAGETRLSLGACSLAICLMVMADFNAETRFQVLEEAMGWIHACHGLSNITAAGP